MTTDKNGIVNPKRISLFEEDEGRTRSFLDVEIKDDGSLEMSGYDIGEWPERKFGNEDYEYRVTVKPEDKDTVLLALIQDRFSNDFGGSNKFMEFLKQKRVPYNFVSWF